MGDRDIARVVDPRLGSLANRPAFVTFPLSPIGSIQISQERVAATKTTFSDLLSAIPLGLGTLSTNTPSWPPAVRR